MIDKKLVGDFAKIIGYIDITSSFDSLNDIKKDYELIRMELLKWVNNYYLYKNFDNITYEKSLEIHAKLQEIRDKKIFDKNIGMESMITDVVFITYEVIVEAINDDPTAI